MPRSFPPILVFIALLAFAAPASADGIFDFLLKPFKKDRDRGSNGRAKSVASFYDETMADDLDGLSLLASVEMDSYDASFVMCKEPTLCKVDLSGFAGHRYVTAKAARHEEVYHVEDGSLYIDVSEWDFPGDKWPNKAGNYPAISNIRVWGDAAAAPVPEPGAAALLMVGTLVVGAAVRRRNVSPAD